MAMRARTAFPGDASREAQQRALQKSHTSGCQEVWANGSLEIGPRKERPKKMLLTEKLDKDVVEGKLHRKTGQTFPLAVGNPPSPL